ncbi:MAG: ECF transporter S component [Proteobacteria bacterium]|nr:ECF transporter S component [Pseudomonadota bacterium]
MDRDALSRARELALAGLLGALGLLLPIGFHALGWGGKVFLPMHLPVVVAGFLVSPATAVTLGFVVPLLSAVLTGMPPLSPPVAPLMALELAAKAGAASVFYRVLRLPLWVALAAAFVADWAVLALAAWFVAGLFAIKAGAIQYVAAAVVIGLPGTILQVIAVPLTVLAIEKRVPRLRPARRDGTSRPAKRDETGHPAKREKTG